MKGITNVCWFLKYIKVNCTWFPFKLKIIFWPTTNCPLPFQSQKYFSFIFTCKTRPENSSKSYSELINERIYSSLITFIQTFFLSLPRLINNDHIVIVWQVNCNILKYNTCLVSETKFPFSIETFSTNARNRITNIVIVHEETPNAEFTNPEASSLKFIKLNVHAERYYSTLTSPQKNGRQRKTNEIKPRDD